MNFMAIVAILYYRGQCPGLQEIQKLWDGKT